MLKVGLTGGIGTGKTVVTEIFKVLGIPVFDADLQAKKIMLENEDLKASIIKQFGGDSYLDGILNRSYLAKQVFNDPLKLEILNSLVHPVTIAAANSWMQQQTTPYVIKEAALIFEAGSGGHLDYVIGVFAPVALRIHRVMQRDHLSREEIKSRMARQISDTIKMKLCDFVLMNDEQQLLIPQVLAVHERLLTLSQVDKKVD